MINAVKPGESVKEAVCTHMTTLLCQHIFTLVQAKCIRLYVQKKSLTISADDHNISDEMVFDPPVLWTPSSSPSDLEKTSSSSSTQILIEPLGPAFVMSHHYIAFPTLTLFSTIPRAADCETALSVLCSSKEVICGLTLRRDEKKLLRFVKERAGHVRVAKGKLGTVSTPDDKAFQLAQIYLGRLRLEAIADEASKLGVKETSSASAGHSGSGNTFSLRMETHHTIGLLTRIARAWCAWCSCSDISSALLPVASALHRALEQQLWPSDADKETNGKRALLQLKGVTEAVLPSLETTGMVRIEHLQNESVSVSDINFACQKTGEFGYNLKSQALALSPLLGIQARQTGADTASGEIILQVELFLETKQVPLSFDIAQGGGGGGGGSSKKGSSSTGHVKQQAPITSFMQRDGGAGAQMGGSGKMTIMSHPTPDAALSAKNTYTLAVTSADTTNGLVFFRQHLQARPITISMRIRRPVSGPNLQIHLLHSLVLSLDTHTLFKPTFPPPIKGTPSFSIPPNSSSSLSSSSSSSSLSSS
jgi:hypothetical protein